MAVVSKQKDSLDKIRSAELRREALGAKSDLHTVIVELDLPQPELQLAGRVDRRGFGMPHIRLAENEPDPVAVERHVSDARRSIERIVGGAPPHFLRHSGSFIIEASGKQLRELADLPSVAAIWPNSLR